LAELGGWVQNVQKKNFSRQKKNFNGRNWVGGSEGEISVAKVFFSVVKSFFWVGYFEGKNLFCKQKQKFYIFYCRTDIDLSLKISTQIVEFIP
jgi:hypothetical protein